MTARELLIEMAKSRLDSELECLKKEITGKANPALGTKIWMTRIVDTNRALALAESLPEKETPCAGN